MPAGQWNQELMAEPAMATLAEGVARTLGAGEFVAAPAEQPVTFFGNTALQLAAACEELGRGVAARSQRLAARVEGGGAEAASLGAEVLALREGLGRCLRCHTAGCGSRCAANARVSAGVPMRGAPAAADGGSPPAPGSLAERVASLQRVGVPIERPAPRPRPRAHRAPPAARPLVVGSLGGTRRRPATDTTSRVSLTGAPAALGATLQERLTADRSLALHFVDIEHGSALAETAHEGARLLSINGRDITRAASLEQIRDELRRRPLELVLESSRSSCFGARPG